MPTAIVDIDLADPPLRVAGLDGYSAAFVVLRYDARVVGTVSLPVFDGMFDIDSVYAGADDAVSAEYWYRAVRKCLGTDDITPADGPLATVAVCTRDRPEDLAQCLEAIERLPPDGQEVLVVDSCSSSESTAEIVSRFPSVRYVRAEHPGLDRARNVALKEASHEIVAFCDDDARVDPGWLRGITSGFLDPSVMCVTGLTLAAELETPAQELFEEVSGFGRGLRRIAFDFRIIDPILGIAAGAGVNMALRRSALTVVGEFDVALDAGTATRSGGDADILRRVLAAGYRVVYEPSALSWHRHRRTWDELVDSQHGYGVGWGAHLLAALLDRETAVPFTHGEWLGRSRRAIRRGELGPPGAPRRELARAYLRGVPAGPRAYLTARWHARRNRS
jgi:glycosyltransferase involved in cell wall biosynthesis